MLNFDFITDEQFRTSLTSDLGELQSCLASQAWKSVHVLAGSIIEALLVEYLVISQPKGSGKDPLTMTLGAAIDACLAAGVLTGRSSKLCDVVKDYRNLIHPGRVVRLNEKYGEDTARIAVSLVSIIAGEVAAKREEKYGLTAEQIVRKVTVDERAAPLIPQLLDEAHEIERRRLVNGVAWIAYSAETSEIIPNEKTLGMLRSCYRGALKSLPVDEQSKAAQKFAKMVRQESAEQLASYGDAFFLCDDIGMLSDSDAAMVKKHIFSRWEAMKTGQVPRFFADTLQGLGSFLQASEIPRFVRLALRFILSPDAMSRAEFSFRAIAEYSNLNNEHLKAAFIEQLEEKRKSAIKRRESAEGLELLSDFIENCKLEIPF